MKKRLFRFLLASVFCGFYTLVATAATSLFSDYGQIQNVQNYSSNPFWSPNSPYNQRQPQPVYVQGADLNTEDCVKVVQPLVAVQCAARDNCKNTQLADIRPAIMVQLSNLPGHNYVSACSGFIDGIFDSYVAQYGNSIPNRQVAFPTATVPNPTVTTPTPTANAPSTAPQIQNPYKAPTPQWQQEMDERSRELEELQRQNSAGNNELSATAFPKTYDDLSFSAKMGLLKDSYEPFKDLNAYMEIEVIGEAEFCAKDINAQGCEGYKKRIEAAKLAQAATFAEVEKADAQNSQSVEDTNSTPTINVDGNTEEGQIINAIVEFLNPQTNDEKTFFTALASDFVPKALKKDDLVLDNSFVYEFLSDKDPNIAKYRKGLLSLSGTAQDEDLHIDIDWDDILIQISTLFDGRAPRRGILVCENHRSIQVGIDTAMWIATVVAAVFSFGSGGVAAAAGRTALGAGLKGLAKGAKKLGLKKAAKAVADKASKQFAKAAIKVGYKKFNGTKRLTKRIAKKAGENILKKKGLLLASGAVAGVIWETAGKKGAAKSLSKGAKAAGVAYSLVESGLSTDIINCTNLDYGEGCYAVCGHDSPTDDLNTKVFKPILGHTYCVNESDYALYDTSSGQQLLLTPEQYVKVTQKVRSIADKGKCDWNEDDIDMYLGAYTYDPDTLQPSVLMIIEEAIRIDD
ncbi:MAG: hypothetical protein IJQ55_01530 [Alphaproteobacteria bacterium]|nr:hypothetical protein [Alphaproteobacteria bacterium]